MRLPIARDAIPHVVLLAAAVVASLFVSHWLGLGFLALLLFVLFFFRDPERAVPGIEAAILAPADGRVVQIRDDGRASTLSIFLSVLDVHVNRAPVSGIVERVEYHRGRFRAAFRHGASLENERNAVTIRTPSGPVTAVQIAGLLARRIVCTVRVGERLWAGDRIGMIKFGSRMDVIAPAGVRWTVPVGCRVRAGVTVIGVPVEAATSPDAGPGPGVETARPRPTRVAGEPS